MRRRIELMSGVASGIAGGAVLMALLALSDDRDLLIANPFILLANPFTIALVLTLLGVAVGAYQHSRYRVPEGRWMLYTGTGLLFLGALIAAVSFGVLLLPAALLALVASVAAQRGDASQPST